MSRPKNDRLCVIYDWMIHGTGLSGNELIILAIIFRASADGGKCYLKCQDLEEETGLSHKAITNCIKSLVEKGLVIRVPINKGGRRTAFVVQQHRMTYVGGFNSTFIVVYRWMLELLCNGKKLQGNRLIVFAMIHGFERFYQSLPTIAEETNISLREASYIVRDLASSGLILRSGSNCESTIKTQADFEEHRENGEGKSTFLQGQKHLFAGDNKINNSDIINPYIYKENNSYNKISNHPSGECLISDQGNDEPHPTAEWLLRLDIFQRIYISCRGVPHPQLVYPQSWAVAEQMGKVLGNLDDDTFTDLVYAFFGMDLTGNYSIYVFLSAGIQSVLWKRAAFG